MNKHSAIQVWGEVNGVIRQVILAAKPFLEMFGVSSSSLCLFSRDFLLHQDLLDSVKSFLSKSNNYPRAHGNGRKIEGSEGYERDSG